MGEQDVFDSGMAVLAQEFLTKLEQPPPPVAEPVRRGARVVDLTPGDVVHRFGTFGKVVKRAHEADDLITGQAPTVSEYVTIQWGHATSARYKDDTLDWYSIVKVRMPPR